MRGKNKEIKKESNTLLQFSIHTLLGLRLVFIEAAFSLIFSREVKQVQHL
jgi:hypothetical protein